MKALTLSVLAFALQINSVGLPNGQVGAPFQASVSGSGGVTPYTWTVTGALPAGLSLNASTGAIAGTPTVAGASTFTIVLTDSAQQTAQKSLSIMIVPAGVQPLAISTTTLAQPAVGTAYAVILQATGGTPPYTWMLPVTSGQLPPGLALNASTGQIAGTPTSAGPYSFTVQVQDSGAPLQTASQAFSVTASAASSLDQYGGDANHACAGTLKNGTPIPGATGFFYLYKDTSLKHWFFCDPVGNRFWMIGVQLLSGMTNAYYAITGPKYVSNGLTYQWEKQEITRLKALGFNAIAEYANQHTWPVDIYNAGNGGNPNKLPFVFEVSPATYAFKDNIKSVMSYMPPAYTDYRGGNFADIFDPAWTSTSIPKWGTAAASDFTPFSGGASGADASPYLLWISLDDADNLWGFKGFTGPYPHLGWMIGTMAPYVGGYTDSKVYIKQQFSTYLCTMKYASLVALNAAWGSNYSTCGSTATTISGEVIGTGDGVTTSFNHTFAHTPVDPSSIGISVTGVLSGSDNCPWFSGTPCPGGLSNGTGTLGAANGGTVNGGTITYSSGVLTVTFSAPPANGIAIAATYQYGGWPKATSGGTGLLDEDGTSSWYPKTSSLPDPPVGTIGLDLDGFLGQIAKQYYSAETSFIKTKYPHHLVVGPDAIGSHTRAVILAQAATYTDAFFFGTIEPQDNTSNLPFDGKSGAVAAYNNYGIPIVAYEIKAANPDSPYPSVTCSVPNDCFSTQAARGASYKNDLSGYFNTYVGTDGYGFVVGSDYWQFTDNSSESQSFGLVTLMDNLYNGIEDCGTTVVDEWGFTTTPESITGCYGDFVTPVKAANRIWLGP
jgi:hypothetical protein